MSTQPPPTRPTPRRPRPRPAQIDPRGPRFAATLTTVVLALALVLAPSPATVALLAVQAVLFAIGAALGVQRTPYGWLFRTLVRPRLGAAGRARGRRPAAVRPGGRASVRGASRWPAT